MLQLQVVWTVHDGAGLCRDAGLQVNHDRGARAARGYDVSVCGLHNDITPY